MTKKILAGLGAAAVIFALTACGGDDKNGDKDTEKKDDTKSTEKTDG